MSLHTRLARFTERADIAIVPKTATSETERQIVIADLPSGSITSLARPEEELDASLTSLWRVYVSVPEAGTLNESQRFMMYGTVDMRIKRVIPIPMGRPQFYELILEEES